MSTFLITGGTGFIGSHLSRELVNRGNDVVLFDIVVDRPSIRDIYDGVEVVRGDVTDSIKLFEVAKRFEIDAIIHYAALLSSAAESDPQLAFKTNFNGLWNVFEVARVMDIESIIFASSVAAYGIDVSEIVREDMYTIPRTLYGISKQLGEMLGLWFYDKYGIYYAGLRYGSVIGPGRRDGGASAYSTLIIQKPAQGDPYVVNVSRDVRMPMIYVKDAVDATLTVHYNIKRLKSRVYNLATLAPNAGELGDEVKRQIPNAEITFCPDLEATRIVNSWPRSLDVNRLNSEIVWKPKYGSVESLVKDFIIEIKQHLDVYKV